MPSWFPQMQTQPRSTYCCLAYICCSTQHSAQAQCPSHGRPHWSRQSSRGAMLQTQLTTDRLQWASLSVGCMLASWRSAWSNTQSSKTSDLPLRQATGRSTTPSIRLLCCSKSLTSTDASSLHCISALWTSSLHMTGCSGKSCGAFFASLASSPEQLQALIDALAAYCATLQMEISVPKTKVMVVSAVPAPAVGFTCNGNPVEQVATFKYLGLHFHQSGSIAHLVTPIKARAGGSWAAVKRRHSLLQCGNTVNLHLHLLQAILVPAVQDGWQIWGMHSPRAAVANDARAAL